MKTLTLFSLALLSSGLLFTPDSRAEDYTRWNLPEGALARGQEKATLQGHAAPVSSVSFSPDGQTLASGSGDSTILLWDMVPYITPSPLDISSNLDLFCSTCGGDEGLEQTVFTNSFLKSKKEICEYAPYKAVDGNPKTAWVEGAKGYGIGAEIIIPKLLNLKKSVKIWAGYGKSQKLFKANGRPKKIEVTILRTKDTYGDPHDARGCGDGYGGAKVVAKHVIILKDLNNYQELPLPEFEVEQYKDFPEEYHRMDGTEMDIYVENLKAGKVKPFKKEIRNHSYFVKLKILDVYKGNKYQDTCISEILN